MAGRKLLTTTTMLYGVVGAAFLSVSAYAGDGTPLLPSTAPGTLLWPATVPGTPPGVDGANGKVEAFGGAIAHNSLAGTQGAFTVPLKGPWGFQLDGAAGNLGGQAFGNVAAHLFWRNPGQGLIGLYTSHTLWDRYGGVYVGHVAGEGELYYGRFTIQGIAGVEFGNYASSTSTSSSNVAPGADNFPFGGTPGTTVASALTSYYDVRTRFFDEVNFKYYFTDNFNGYVGHRYLGGKNALALGSEYALPIGHNIEASAFVEARVGEANYNGVWGGVKFYFGQHDKPLIARNRQEDPNIWSTDNLFSITNSAGGSSSSSSSQYCGPGGTLGGGSCEYGFFE